MRDLCRCVCVWVYFLGKGATDKKREMDHSTEIQIKQWVMTSACILKVPIKRPTFHYPRRWTPAAEVTHFTLYSQRQHSSHRRRAAGSLKFLTPDIISSPKSWSYDELQECVSVSMFTERTVTNLVVDSPCSFLELVGEKGGKKDTLEKILCNIQVFISLSP